MSVKSVSDLQTEDLYPAITASRANGLHRFKSKFNIQPEVVYAPGCGTDIGHCQVFDDARRIVNVDQNSRAIHVLRQEFATRPNIESYVSRAQDFKLDEPVDLLVVFSFLFFIEDFQDELFDLVNKGGYVLSNASYPEFEDRPNFKLLAEADEEGNIIEGHLPNGHPITTDDELIRARCNTPHFVIDEATYEEAKRIVEVILGKQSNVMEAYKSLRRLAIEQGIEKLKARHRSQEYLELIRQAGIKNYSWGENEYEAFAKNQERRIVTLNSGEETVELKPLPEYSKGGYFETSLYQKVSR